MLHKSWQLLTVLFVLTIGSAAVSAQTAPIPRLQTSSLAQPKNDLARAERRTRVNSKTEILSNEKKKTKRFSYSYLLPFGVGQFEQNKTLLGTAFATTQAGFLLLYFDRLNAIRNSNADAADVMRGADFDAASSDPTILSFLDQNEAYTLQAQQQANLALIGFFAVYTLGVVDAVFDPLSSLKVGNQGKKKKRDSTERSDMAILDGGPRLVQEAKAEETNTQIGLFYQPAAASRGAVGLSVQKPL